MKRTALPGAILLTALAFASMWPLAAPAADAPTLANTKPNGTFADEDFAPPKIPLPVFRDAAYNVKDFGATGDGKTNDAPAIDKAIIKCNADGGGTINFPAGHYMIASVHLKSNIKFVLDKDALIQGLATGYDEAEPAEEFGKYQDGGHSHYHDALFWGEDIENFAVIGGSISGGGTTTSDPKPGGADKIFAVKVGKNFLFKDIIHPKGGHFAYLMNDCENITFDHLTLKSSRDGIDIMGCRNVACFGCNFTGCGDDTFGIKSDYILGRRILTQNIY